MEKHTKAVQSGLSDYGKTGQLTCGPVFQYGTFSLRDFSNGKNLQCSKLRKTILSRGL